MIEQVEQLPALDGLRTLAQLLIDAGGIAPAVTWCDVEDADIGLIDPALRFTIANTRHQGFLTLRYKRVPDVYELDLIAADGVTIVQSQGEIYFDQLANITMDWVDDGMWRLAQVEIIRAATKRAGP